MVSQSPVPGFPEAKPWRTRGSQPAQTDAAGPPNREQGNYADRPVGLNRGREIAGWDRSHYKQSSCGPGPPAVSSWAG